MQDIILAVLLFIVLAIVSSTKNMFRYDIMMIVDEEVETQIESIISHAPLNLVEKQILKVYKTNSDINRKYELIVNLLRYLQLYTDVDSFFEKHPHIKTFIYQQKILY